MANIQISQLHPAGSSFFHESESYLNELSEQEIVMIEGRGRGRSLINSDIYINSQITASQGISINTATIVSKVSEVRTIAKLP